MKLKWVLNPPPIYKKPVSYTRRSKNRTKGFLLITRSTDVHFNLFLQTSLPETVCFFFSPFWPQRPIRFVWQQILQQMHRNTAFFLPLSNARAPCGSKVSYQYGEGGVTVADGWRKKENGWMLDSLSLKCVEGACAIKWFLSTDLIKNGQYNNNWCIAFFFSFLIRMRKHLRCRGGMKTAFAVTLFAVLERQEELPRRQAPFQIKTDSLLN